MSYFMLYETATGRPISQSSVAADPVRAGYTSLDIGTKPSSDTMWDETTKAFIARPPKVFVDRIDDLMKRPGMDQIWQSLGSGQRTVLKDAFIWILGKERMRGENNSEVIK